MVTLFSFLKLGASFHEWIEEGQDNASKKMLPKLLKVPKFYFSTSTEKFIYLIRAHNAPYFKIGYSGNPEDRVKQLQTGSMFPLELLQKWSVKDVCKAEKEVHTALQNYNRALRYPELGWKTEWFELKDGLTMNHVALQISSLLEKYKPGPNEI